MEIRVARPQDLDLIAEIDGTVESAEYLHLEQSGEGMAMSWRVERRPMREKLIQQNPLGEDRAFVVKQIATGVDEGLVLCAEHRGAPVALLAAQPDYTNSSLHLIDVRVDYDYRRQGLATAMLYQAINHARDADLRAVRANVAANNFPGNQLLLKCSFELSGIDTRRHSNHDVVKESATLIWYASLD
jgi:RimJ/RimL family protein N-acetyltransferase